jgi:DNA-binding response OmpR family regulator
MKGDKEEFLSSGFDFYLAKPFTKEELRATIKRFLR